MSNRVRARERMQDLQESIGMALARIDGERSFQGNSTADADLLGDILGDPFDLISLEVAGGQARAVYLDTLVEEDRLLHVLVPHAAQGEWNAMPLAALPASVVHAVRALLRGEAVVLRDGFEPYACTLSFPASPMSAALEPATERVVRGPRMALPPHLRHALGMLRARLPHPDLRVDLYTFGRYSRTRTVVCYMRGVADPAVGRELRSRLSRVAVDVSLETSELSHFIGDGPWSPFPTMQPTERLDAVAQAVSWGRFAILQDGAQTAVLVPTRFADLVSSPEDYYLSPYMTTFSRLMRYVGSLVAVTLPSFYIALVTVQPELIPTPLALAIARSRHGVPFPTFIEVLVMELTIELVREAGLRLPSVLSTAVTIVGALVIGQSVVAAGIISAPVVIVVAVTALASFTLPQYESAFTIRLLRFPMMPIAAVLGLFGITWYLAMLLAHVCQLRSFGVPYFAPFAPVREAMVKDAFFHLPPWAYPRRPMLSQANPRRVGPDAQPKVPRSGR